MSFRPFDLIYFVLAGMTLIPYLSILCYSKNNGTMNYELRFKKSYNLSSRPIRQLADELAPLSGVKRDLLQPSNLWGEILRLHYASLRMTLKVFFFFLFLYAILYMLSHASLAHAQASLSTPIPLQPNIILTPTPRPSPQPVDRSVNVSATVGDFTLTVSGSIAPYASITLIAGDTPLKAVVADALGNFTIKVQVAKGFNQFCLDAIDIKRYGESYSCFILPAVYSNSSDSNLYLPPTVGIDRKELIAGESIIVRGYGLPDSYTLIHLSNGRILYIHTDSSGFYEVKIAIDKVGSYSLFANATFKGKPSVNPQKKLSFSAISPWENFLRLLVKLITPPLLYVWIILLVLMLAIIRVLSKKYSQLQRSIRRGWGRKSTSKLLHHAWFVGY